MKWEWALRPTELWWDLTYYPYKYGQPRGWTAADLLARIDRTWVDGDSRYQVRIHEIEAVAELVRVSPNSSCATSLKAGP